MINKKGVSVVLSMILIMGIILIGLLVTLRWGLPIIDTNRDLLEINEMENSFSEINSKISRISLEGNLASRQIDLNLEFGKLQVLPDKEIIKYSITTNQKICDSQALEDISFSSTTSIPSAITSQSGTIYTTSYILDEVLKYLIISDSEVSGEYNTLYVKENNNCYKKYFTSDIYITENNSYGFLFLGLENNIGKFNRLRNVEENMYKLCNSGRANSEYSLFLKYKNPEFIGTNCTSIDTFGIINISEGTMCTESCSLSIINRNGDIQITQV